MGKHTDQQYKNDDSRPTIMFVAAVPLTLKLFCKDLIQEVGRDYNVALVSSAGYELDEFSSQGLDTKSINIRRSISILADIKALSRLIVHFRKTHPDIVHSLTPKAGLLAMMAAWTANVPIRIHSFTGLLFPTAVGMRCRILKAIDKLICHFSTHVLPESLGVGQDLRSIGIDDHQMHMIGNGSIRGIDLNYYRHTSQIDAEADRLRIEYGLNAACHIFLFVGRIVPDKGIHELLVAFRRVVGVYPNAHLMIVGSDEPERYPLSEEILQGLSTISNVHYTKRWVEDVRPYYALCDTLVHPSYREGMPNVVLEAGAMGIPAIVTDINGSREIVKDGINGTVVPAKDADRLASVMMEYVKHPSWHKKCSTSCRTNIAEKYEAKKLRKHQLSFYRATITNLSSHNNKNKCDINPCGTFS